MAAEHYARAAQLAPSYDRLLAASRLALLSGDLTRAAYFGQELLGIAREQFGEEAPKYGNALNERALALNAMGRHAEAEPLYRRATEISKATVGEKHSAMPPASTTSPAC